MVSALSIIATSQEQAAETLGCDARTFARWLKRGCPGSPRSYPLREAIAWAKENVWSEDAVLIEAATGEDGSVRTQYMQQKVEKLRRENQLTDLKIQSQGKRFVDIDEVSALLTEQANVIRSSLETLERKHGPDALNIVLEALEELDSSFDINRTMD